MTMDAQHQVPSAPRKKLIWRLIGSIVGGCVVMLAGPMLAVGLVLLLSRLGAWLLLLALLAALACFFGGGVIARLLAGPNLWKDLVGRASAVLFVALGWVSQFLPRWTYEDHRWVRTPSIYYYNSWLGVLVNLLLNLFFAAVLLVVVDIFAFAGDRWMSRRLAAKQRPRFEAEA